MLFTWREPTYQDCYGARTGKKFPGDRTALSGRGWFIEVIRGADICTGKYHGWLSFRLPWPDVYYKMRFRLTGRLYNIPRFHLWCREIA